MLPGELLPTALKCNFCTSSGTLGLAVIALPDDRLLLAARALRGQSSWSAVPGWCHKSWDCKKPQAFGPAPPALSCASMSVTPRLGAQCLAQKQGGFAESGAGSLESAALSPPPSPSHSTSAWFLLYPPAYAGVPNLAGKLLGDQRLPC